MIYDMWSAECRQSVRWPDSLLKVTDMLNVFRGWKDSTHKYALLQHGFRSLW